MKQFKTGDKAPVFEGTDQNGKTISLNDFKVPLIADEDRKVIEQFGVWGPKKFMGKEYDGIHRTTFLIDGDQNIAGVIDKVNTKDHANEILEIFK